ncbi:MAG: apolipoprotein N-acyltransferase [Methylophilaceae bacterium]|jgi:apolipoprotein N-acyltransferase
MKLILNNPQVSALILGSLCVFGFAPFYLFPIPIFALAGLFYLWQQTSSAGQAARLGFIFGLGFFIAGIHWIYVSLHDVGGMPWWMAGIATFGLCAFLALFHALAGYLSKRMGRVLCAAPILWTLLEWLREWLLTGFPWLNVGYSQVPYSPLANFAPIVGILGVTFAVTLTAAWILQHSQHWTKLLLIWTLATALSLVNWSSASGPALQFALLQGNVPQTLKWDAEVAQQTSVQYYHMMQTAMTQPQKPDVIVLPETALPYAINSQEIGQHPVTRAFSEYAKSEQVNLVVGVIEEEQQQYYNSMLALGVDGGLQSYRKSHLVPFGEFIPFKQWLDWLYRDWLHIPMSDLSRGHHIGNLTLAGQQVGFNICYEDVFGNEIRRQLPQANILVNTSNDAWYGHSIAAYQHLQFSQARALESARWMLRATNTGITAAINQHGQVVQALPDFVQDSLYIRVPSLIGTTPYTLVGNWLILSLLWLALLLLWAGKNK